MYCTYAAIMDKIYTFFSACLALFPVGVLRRISFYGWRSTTQNPARRQCLVVICWEIMHQTFPSQRCLLCLLHLHGEDQRHIIQPEDSVLLSYAEKSCTRLFRHNGVRLVFSTFRVKVNDTESSRKTVSCHMLRNHAPDFSVTTVFALSFLPSGWRSTTQNPAGRQCLVVICWEIMHQTFPSQRCSPCLFYLQGEGQRHRIQPEDSVLLSYAEKSRTRLFRHNGVRFVFSTFRVKVNDTESSRKTMSCCHMLRNHAPDFSVTTVFDLSFLPSGWRSTTQNPTGRQCLVVICWEIMHQTFPSQRCSICLFYLQVTALYDYRAQRSDELSLVAGDPVVVLHEDGDHWWMGEMSDGQQGYFPANYVMLAGVWCDVCVCTAIFTAFTPTFSNAPFSVLMLEWVFLPVTMALCNHGDLSVT